MACLFLSDRAFHTSWSTYWLLEETQYVFTHIIQLHTGILRLVSDSNNVDFCDVHANPAPRHCPAPSGGNFEYCWPRQTYIRPDEANEIFKGIHKW